MTLRPSGQVSNDEHQRFLRAIENYRLTRDARPLFKACGRMWDYTDQVALRDSEVVEDTIGKKFSGSFGEAARAIRRYLVAPNCD